MIISFDLSPELYKNLLRAKGYEWADAEADRYLADHQSFLARFPAAAATHLTDETFSARLEFALGAAHQFIADKNVSLR